MYSLKDIFTEIHSKTSTNPSKKLLIGKRSLSYREVFLKTSQLAQFFADKNLEVGDSITILTEDQIETTLILIACLRYGIKPLFISTDVSSKNLSRYLNFIKSKLTIMDYNISKELQKDIELPFKNVCLNYKGVNPLIRWKKQIYNRYKKNKVMKQTKDHLDNLEIKLEQDVLFLLSSGTTGINKIIPITHHNLISQLDIQTKELSCSEDTRCLSTFKMTHIDGIITTILLPFKTFSTTIYLERGIDKLSPMTIINCLKKYKATSIICAPNILVILLKYNKNLKKDFEEMTHFKLAIVTAAYIPPSLWKEFAEKIKKPVYNIYGMSEIGSLVSIAKPEHYEKQSYDTIGPIVIGDFFILDEEKNPVSIGEMGELVVSGPTCVEKYIGEVLPFITKNNKKWLQTGDLVVETKEGFLTFKGRKKNIIRPSGQTISPQEVNGAFLICEDVIEVETIGIEDDVLGDIVASGVVLRKDSSMKKDDLFRFLDLHLDKLRIPRIIEFFSKLPKGPSGKVSQKKLKAMIIERMEENLIMNSIDGVKEKILNIAEKSLRMSKKKLNLYTSMDSVQSWDSLAHFDMIIQIEKVFNIKFSMKEIIEVKTLKDFESIILQHKNI